MLNLWYQKRFTEVETVSHSWCKYIDSNFKQNCVIITCERALTALCIYEYFSCMSLSNPEWVHLNIKTVHFIMFPCSEYIKKFTGKTAMSLIITCVTLGWHFQCSMKVLFRLHIMWKNPAGNKAERRERERRVWQRPFPSGDQTSRWLW